MIKVHCFKCEKELEKPGAIVLSPPRGEMVMKYHLCEECFNGVLLILVGIHE